MKITAAPALDLQHLTKSFPSGTTELQAGQGLEDEPRDSPQPDETEGDGDDEKVGGFVVPRRRGSKQSILPPASFLAPKRRPSAKALRSTYSSTIASGSNAQGDPPEPIPQKDVSAEWSHAKAGSNSTQQSQGGRRGDATRETDAWHGRTAGVGEGTSSTGHSDHLARTVKTSSATRMTASSREPLLYPPRRAPARDDRDMEMRALAADFGAGSATTTMKSSETHTSACDGGKASQPGHEQHHAPSDPDRQRPRGPAKKSKFSARPPAPPGFVLETPKSRNYAAHRGANRFFIAGILLTADANPWHFICSVALVLVLGGLWFGFEAPFYWHSVSPAVVIIFAYLWLSILVNMLVAAWRDPGILPRDLDRNPPMTTGDGDFGSIRAGYDPDDPLYTPMPRVIRIRNGQDLTVKWCETCRTYRPPRSSHCRVCDNCVDLIDHHCIYLNTCIARRNYVPFWAFLSYTILTSFVILVTCAVHLYLLTLPSSRPLPVGGSFGGGRNFEGALRASPVSAVLFLLLIGALIPVCMLFRYHLRLVALGRTTAEEIRISTNRDYTPKAERKQKTSLLLCRVGKPGVDPNPFAYRNPLRNVAQALFRPAVGIESYIDRRGWRHKDARTVPPQVLASMQLRTREPAHGERHNDGAETAMATATGTADEPYGSSSRTRKSQADTEADAHADPFSSSSSRR